MTLLGYFSWKSTLGYLASCIEGWLCVWIYLIIMICFDIDVNDLILWGCLLYLWRVNILLLLLWLFVWLLLILWMCHSQVIQNGESFQYVSFQWMNDMSGLIEFLFYIVRGVSDILVVFWWFYEFHTLWLLNVLLLYLIL